jgi:hypothetical protein
MTVGGHRQIDWQLPGGEFTQLVVKPRPIAVEDEHEFDARKPPLNAEGER